MEAGRGAVSSGRLFRQQHPGGWQCAQWPLCRALHGAGSSLLPCSGKQGGSWQPGSSVVSSDEKPGEREGQPEAEPGMGGQRRPEGFAHLGEWMDSAEAKVARPRRVGLTVESWGGPRALHRLGPEQALSVD